MQKNFKDLKFYKGLTNISPLMFELKMKLECDYNFFNRAEHSLKVSEAYGLEIENGILNIHRHTRPGLALYVNLPLQRHLDVFCQIMLKLAIFHWKFLPSLLVDLFKGYPLVGPEVISFSNLELEILDAGFKLPHCIDELYIIMLEKGWHHTMQRDDSGTGDPYGSFDVVSHREFHERFKNYIQFLQKKQFPLDSSTIVGLYVVHMRNIPQILDLMTYGEESKKGPAMPFVVFGKSMEHVSLFTNQLLLVNPFFDFSSKRDYYKKTQEELSSEKKESMLKASFSKNIKKKIRPYKTYEEGYAGGTTGFGPYFNYPGQLRKNYF